jgi:hypothetical protein
VLQLLPTHNQSIRDVSRWTRERSVRRMWEKLAGKDEGAEAGEARDGEGGLRMSEGEKERKETALLCGASETH